MIGVVDTYPGAYDIVPKSVCQYRVSFHPHVCVLAVGADMLHGILAQLVPDRDGELEYLRDLQYGGRIPVLPRKFGSDGW